MELPITGGCGCGTVRFEVDAPFVSAGYCHCGRCQRRSGTASSANARAEPGSVCVVQGETEREAQDFYRHYVHDLGDWKAAENVINTMGLNAHSIPPERMEAMKEHFVAGWSGYPLIGTKDPIVDGLEKLSGTGLDGVLLSWPRFIDGMTEFRDVTYPLVKQAGLR